MPTFLFSCDPCGHQFDLFRAVAGRDDPARCPECGGDARRVFTACALRQPPKAWGVLTARDLLGPKDDEARARVTVTVGSPKVRPRL